MQTNGYYITRQDSEDRLDRADNLADAIRIARELALEEAAEGPVCIEHKGLAVRQFMLLPDGTVEEAELV